MVVLVASLVWGRLLVLGGLVLTVVGGEVAETRVVSLCGVLVGAVMRMVAVLGVGVGVMVGLGGAGVVVLGAPVLAGIGGEVLGARLEGGCSVVGGGHVTTWGRVVCSVGMGGCGGEVTAAAFSIVSSPSSYSYSSSSASPTLPQLGLKWITGLRWCSGGLWHSTFSGASSTFVFSRPRSG